MDANGATIGLERRAVIGDDGSLLEGPLDDRARNALFGVGQDGWYPLFAHAISGTCVAVSPGKGRQVPLLSALANQVVVLEPSAENRATIETLCADYPVITVGGTLEAAPFAPGSVDTLIVPASTAHESQQSRLLEDCATLLADDGSLVLTRDGPTRVSGMTALCGPDETVERPTPRQLLESTRFVTQRSLERAGFDHVKWYALAPTSDWFEWLVPLDDETAVDWLLETNRPASWTGQLVHTGARVAARLGVLDHAWPSLVAVCRKQPQPELPTHVLKRGANRSLVFELEGNSLERVKKVPNHPRHGHFNERSATVRNTLADPATGSITASAIPEATLEDSSPGPTLLEAPMEGTALAKGIDGATLRSDPEAFARVLETGLGWITRLQCDHREATITRSPEEIVATWTVPELDLEPPQPPHPLSYPTVPCHGDYHPGNVVVDDQGTVETVIDWEYATLEGNPVADPLFFTLKVAERTFGSFEAGIAGLLKGGTHGTVVGSHLGTWGRQLDLDPPTIAHLAGSTFSRQIAVHVDHDTPYRHHTTPRRKRDRLETLFEYITDLEAFLERHWCSGSMSTGGAVPDRPASDF